MQTKYATKSSCHNEKYVAVVVWKKKIKVLLRRLYENNLFSYEKEVLWCVSFFAYVVYM